MNIVSIEPTPSPNSMKLNMDERLPDGERRTYAAGTPRDYPVYVSRLLEIPEVRSVFQTADFIAIERRPKGQWQAILAAAREAFGEGDSLSGGLVSAAVSQEVAGETYGQASVFLQTFRGIPLQVRVRSGLEEVREGLPGRFAEAAMKAQSASPNLIKERVLEDIGVRYGELKEIAGKVAAEIDAAYGAERLDGLVEAAMNSAETSADKAGGRRGSKLERELHDVLNLTDKLAIWDDPDWKIRYNLLDKLKPALEDIAVLAKALEDENSSIRRLATVYLGDLKQPQVLPYLFRALEDKSVSVRRTAGDCLSDIGDAAAVQPMIKALKDQNKLVRWRAARFLYEAGDQSAVAALREAEDDSEFEVSLQVKIALERIEGGSEAEGSVWQQMTKLRK